MKNKTCFEISEELAPIVAWIADNPDQVEALKSELQNRLMEWQRLDLLTYGWAMVVATKRVRVLIDSEYTD
jgi:hypothetical protein